MPKVYLIAQPSIDRRGRTLNLSGLAKYGEVVVLVPDGDSPSYRPRDTINAMVAKLTENGFDPKQDYFVWAGGDTLAAVLAGVIVERLQVNTLRWLRFDKKRDEATGHWDHKNGAYMPVNVPLYEEQNDVQQISA